MTDITEKTKETIAKIISESGARWPAGFNYAAYDEGIRGLELLGDEKEIRFYISKPEFKDDLNCWISESAIMDHLAYKDRIAVSGQKISPQHSLISWREFRKIAKC